MNRLVVSRLLLLMAFYWHLPEDVKAATKVVNSCGKTNVCGIMWNSLARRPPGDMNLRGTQTIATSIGKEKSIAECFGCTNVSEWSDVRI